MRERPDAQQEAALRALHRDLPHRDGFWYAHLEGSYAVADDLRTIDGLGRDWLYADHGWDELVWSDHCNQPWTRWILREHGITLLGPCPADLVGEEASFADPAGSLAALAERTARTWSRM